MCVISITFCVAFDSKLKNMIGFSSRAQPRSQFCCHMALQVKRPKGKRRRDSDLLPEGQESETQTSPPKKGRLTGRPTDAQELQDTENRTESSNI